MWGLFSAFATAAQWVLEGSGLLSQMMVGTSAALGAVLLIAAGVWQLTPLKASCLRHCRSPFGFLSANWRPGARGALRMGLHHGAYCLGCCWFLMALLFVGGVMNLYWIIGLAVFVIRDFCRSFLQQSVCLFQDLVRSRIVEGIKNGNTCQIDAQRFFSSIQAIAFCNKSEYRFHMPQRFLLVIPGLGNPCQSTMPLHHIR